MASLAGDRMWASILRCLTHPLPLRLTETRVGDQGVPPHVGFSAGKPGEWCVPRPPSDSPGSLGALMGYPSGTPGCWPPKGPTPVGTRKASSGPGRGGQQPRGARRPHDPRPAPRELRNLACLPASLSPVSLALLSALGHSPPPPPWGSATVRACSSHGIWHRRVGFLGSFGCGTDGGVGVGEAPVMEATSC